MCFSPTASFGSAAILTVLGVGATKLNRTPSQKMFVALPIIFGVQQASEGFVWLTMGAQDSQLHSTSVFIFLFFALAVWPTWVSWSVYQTETDKKRKNIMMVLAALGLVVSLSTTWMLLSAPPSARITGHSLAYSFSNPHIVPANIEFLAYVLPTVLPFFISSLALVRNTGYLIMGGLLLSFYVNREASASIWCFFAAMASLYVVVKVFSQAYPNFKNEMSSFKN